MNRTHNSIKNLIIILTGQIVCLVLNYVSRIFFVKYFSKEILGLDSLMTSIINVLSVTELGLGTAITYALYSPLKENDNEKIKSLMNFFKKCYYIVGVIILFIGIILVVFIEKILPQYVDLIDLRMVLLLFILTTVITYFVSYKKILVNADQKKYVTSLFRYTFYALILFFQILAVIVYANYYIFLMISLVLTLIENILCNIRINKLYPYIKEKNIKKLEKEDKDAVVKNIKAIFLHRIGGTIVGQTDSILLTVFASLTFMGVYSNYKMVIAAATTFLAQMFIAISASVGNLSISADRAYYEEKFNKIYFVSYWIFSIVAICFAVLIQDFVHISYGSDYVIEIQFVIIMAINLFIYGIRQTTLTFKDGLGLFHKDRYKSLIEALVNLIFSIGLSLWIGPIGIFIGTLISSVFVDYIVEGKVLYNYGFNKSVKNYLLKSILFVIIFASNYIITQFLIELIFEEVTIFSFILKIIVSFVFSNLIFIIMHFRNQNLKYWICWCITLFKKALIKIFNRGNE